MDLCVKEKIVEANLLIFFSVYIVPIFRQISINLCELVLINDSTPLINFRN